MTRFTLFSIISLMLFLSVEASGLTGIGIGARAGVVSNYDNPELSFEQAENIDIDKLTMVGGHVRFKRFPIFTLEVVAEYSWRNRDFGVLGETISGKVKDFMVAANLKYLVKIPILTPYFGGGLATHQMTYEFNPPLTSVLDGNKIIIPDDGPKFGMHALAGVAFCLPASPLEFFIEARIGKISGDDDSTDYSSIYGGVTLKLL